MNNNTGGGRSRGIGIYLIILVVLMGTVGVLLTNSPKTSLTYSDVIELFETEQVKAFVVEDLDLQADLDVLP